MTATNDINRLAQFGHSIAEPEPTRDHPQLPATGKAGRNLPAAIGVGVGLLVLVIALIFLPSPVLAVFITLVVCAALWELAGALARIGIHLALPPLWVGTVGITVCAFLLGSEAVFGALCVTLLAVVLWCLMGSNTSAKSLRDNILASAFAGVYLPFLASFAVMIVSKFGDNWLFAVFVALTVASDLGGYIAGVLAGKHPLAPSVSPAKTWEGFTGSVLLSAGAGAISFSLLSLPVLPGVLLGMLSALFCTIGDLGESLIKRDLKLKDMGSLLPGHGGIMDRLDSLLINAPLVFTVFYLVIEA
ncbi:MAG: phosphatidate cytidylyltransferase [Varibaculum sp.]|nr:phosphatidate cytidylyltransferase [Varibaculum sp.]